MRDVAEYLRRLGLGEAAEDAAALKLAEAILLAERERTARLLRARDMEEAAGAIERAEHWLPDEI
ncbi:MAG: hypothetical protein ACK4K7_02960 [Allosphingosinicella sp.]|uniref:hypothetical protein n=1 Tax=Allosphingosinicella sp. TaxID=2823234 RepID=UPI003921A6FD